MSLYADFIKETFGKDIIEDDDGFATFLIVKKECYVENVYVRPEARKSTHSFHYVDQIVEKAKAQGCRYLLTTVNKRISTPERSKHVILKYGFMPYSEDDDCEVFFKEI